MKKRNKENIPRIVYRKLKHLHQVQWDTYSTFSRAPGSDSGVWSVNVIIPNKDAMYVWHSANNQLLIILTKNKDDIKTFCNYDFKLFIKMIKRILRNKDVKLYK